MTEPGQPYPAHLMGPAHDHGATEACKQACPAFTRVQEAPRQHRRTSPAKHDEDA